MDTKTYTPEQVKAALFLADYHSTPPSQRSENDYVDAGLAVMKLAGAPMSSVLAWAVRNAQTPLCVEVSR